MALGVMRTPRHPHETFMDDPLRALRIIRFPSKLNYTIDNVTQLSMRDERVHTAFSVTINRQRLGNEVRKIMNSRNPLKVFHLIHETGLYPTIFLGSAWEVRRAFNYLVIQKQPENPWAPPWARAYRCLAISLDGNGILGKEPAQSEERPEYLWTMAAYAPLAGLRAVPEKIVQCMTEAIETTTHVSKLMERSLLNMDDIVFTVNQVEQDHKSRKLPRSAVGLAIRRWGVTWRIQVLYPLLTEVTYDQTGGEGQLNE